MSSKTNRSIRYTRRGSRRGSTRIKRGAWGK